MEMAASSLAPAPGAGQTSLKCPVCAAAFRSAETCPRCGVNLQPLMRIAARAWALRQRCRAKLLEGDVTQAMQYAAQAWQIQRQGPMDFSFWERYRKSQVLASGSVRSLGM